jgi:hypothetical protein
LCADIDLDDLTILVDGPEDVATPPSNADARLIK